MRILSILVWSLALGLVPTVSHACAVCFGDPNSLQVQGAEAGVLFLLGVIVTVLLAIASMILFWIFRARRIGRANNVSLPA